MAFRWILTTQEGKQAAAANDPSSGRGSLLQSEADGML